MTLADSLRKMGFGITATPKPVQKWIRLTEDEHEQVKAIAQELGISEAQTLRALVLKGMEE